MSNQQNPNAKLAGFEGPHYPEEVQQARDIIDTWDECSGVTLGASAANMPNYLGIGSVVTSDGYKWFWALKFKAEPRGVVMIAFPWAQDWDENDGTQADRSIAVYTKDATAEQTTQVLEAFVAQMPRRVK